MQRLIECRDHGQVLPAVMCRHLMDDSSLEWVEMPAVPDLGDEFRDWRCYRCARQPAADLAAAGELRLVCMQHARAVQKSATVISAMVLGETPGGAGGPSESRVLCRHLVRGGSRYWIELPPCPDPDSGRVVHLWVCPECVEYELTTLSAQGSLIVAFVAEAERLRRRDELTGARFIPWTDDSLCEDCAARESQSPPAPRLSVVAKPEKKRRKRRK
jgi:hypothetical protein